MKDCGADKVTTKCIKSASESPAAKCPSSQSILIHKQTTDLSDSLSTWLLMHSDVAEIYLIGLLPALNTAELRGPQVTAPPLSSKCRQAAWAPGGRAVRAPPGHPTPLSGKGGTARDGRVMVPLAREMLVLIDGVLMLPAEGTWHFSTFPPFIKVRKAALLFAQVESHSAALLPPRNTDWSLLTSPLCLLLLLVPLL